MKWVVDTKFFSGHAKTYLPDDHTCPYTGKTAEEFQAEGYEIMDNESFDILVERFEDNLCGRWCETTEEQYNDMLNILPPMAWYGGGFFVSEPYTSNICNFYQKLGGRYYTSLQRVRTPRGAILASLAKFIEEEKA